MVKTANLALVPFFSGDNRFILTSYGATSTSAPGGVWKTCYSYPDVGSCSLLRSDDWSRLIKPSADSSYNLSIFQSLQPQRKRRIVSQFSPNTPNKALRIFASRER
ncbi:MAG TPA: hypothetical protein VMU26_06015 [Candidatus Polarisedimenticolia bacterium]|nr:hypothetical protein [Candidatus Polarisedimenticolia bacterium]